MLLMMNDVSFQYIFYNKTEAVEALHQLVMICKKLESGHFSCVDGKIITCEIDKMLEIVPGYKIISILQQIQPIDEKRYLLSLLTNRVIIDNQEEEYCIILGKKSKIHDINGIAISLQSNEVFSKEIIKVLWKGTQAELKNISCDEHINVYGLILGQRIYKGNSKKHKSDTYNSYGKGKIASPMDLTDVEAQQLLDKAVCIKGRLYGRKNGINYAFQNERDVFYHGYQVNDLSDDIIKILDLYEW